MSRAEQFYRAGRADLLAGKVDADEPPVDGGPRWGVSAILRPRGDVVERLRSVAASIAHMIGPGHWVHGKESLHTTLRSFEPYSTRDMDDDLRVGAYADAVAEACDGFAPVSLTLQGVAPHSGGIMMVGKEEPQGLPLLQQRLAAALQARDVVDDEADFTRDLWYVQLVHFAGPVHDPTALVKWGDERREEVFGTCIYNEVEIVRWFHVDGSMRNETLHRVKLDG